jgi:hypoxanthine phosphoribosyltransferase
MRDLRQDIAAVLIGQDQLQQRIQQIARDLEAHYQQAGVDEIILLCILKGGYIFLADLSRALNIPHEVNFMAVSSYNGGTESSGAVRILLDLQQDITGKHILIVEDIIDSGLTLDYMRQTLQARHPASLRVCSLLSKPSRHKIQVPVEHIGFEVPDEFVVGYGLDYDQLYRNLPYIAILKPEVFGG